MSYTKPDFKEGEYYHIEMEHSNVHFMIIQYERFRPGDSDRIAGPSLSNMNKYPRFEFSKDCWIPNRPIRKATSEEILWFEACRKAGKIIPRHEVKVEVINNYQIY